MSSAGLGPMDLARLANGIEASRVQSYNSKLLLLGGTVSSKFSCVRYFAES